MKKIHRSKYGKIIIDFKAETTYIEVCDKYGLCMSSISENLVKEQINEDINDALIHIKQKCARRWFKRQIKMFRTIR